jgi:hypothetical protein
MKPFFLTDEVIIERKKDEVFASYELEFKGHHFILSQHFESIKKLYYLLDTEFRFWVLSSAF